MKKVGCWRWSYVSGKISCTTMGFIFLDEIMPPFISYSSVTSLYDLIEEEDAIQWAHKMQEGHECQNEIVSWESKDYLLCDQSRNDLKNIKKFAMKEPIRSSYNKLETNFLFLEQKETLRYS